MSRRVETRGSARSQRGLSLVELMIAMALGLLVLAAIAGAFVTASRNYRQDERMVRLQDELHFALAALGQEIELAGFWGETLNPSAIGLDASLNDPGCGAIPRWAYVDRTTPLRGVDNATPAAVAAAFPCIQAADVTPGTDVLAIKHVAGRLAAPGTQGALLRANSTTGLLLVGTAPAASAGADQFWEYRPSIFYVRRYAVTPGDGVPTLCRKVLEGAIPAFTSECLAAGIEDLQVEYGLDADGDGAADRFASAPTAAEFGQAVQVRVWLLARSEQAMTGYTNLKSYRLGNAPVRAPNDRFFRRIAGSSHAVRNPAALRVLLGPG